MPAREQLLKLRRRLHIRAEEVKAAKAAAERETLADAAAIVERLRSVEALKQVMLTANSASRFGTGDFAQAMGGLHRENLGDSVLQIRDRTIPLQILGFL